MPRKTERTREYVSHDPHTVVLLRPDALKRLEGYLRTPVPANHNGPRPWVSGMTGPYRGWFRVEVQPLRDWCGLVTGHGHTLSAAIHAALDQAGEKS